VVKRTTDIIITLLVFNVFLIRPSALGQSLTPLAMIISAALATTYALSRKSEPVFHRQLIQHAAMIAGALTAYYSYIFIISLAFSNPTFIDYV